MPYASYRSQYQMKLFLPVVGILQRGSANDHRSGGVSTVYDDNQSMIPQISRVARKRTPAMCECFVKKILTFFEWKKGREDKRRGNLSLLSLHFIQISLDLVKRPEIWHFMSWVV